MPSNLLIFSSLLILFQIFHEKVYDTLLEKLKKSYAQIMKRVGDPLEGEDLSIFCWGGFMDGKYCYIGIGNT